MRKWHTTSSHFKLESPAYSLCQKRALWKHCFISYHMYQLEVGQAFLDERMKFVEDCSAHPIRYEHSRTFFTAPIPEISVNVLWPALHFPYIPDCTIIEFLNYTEVVRSIWGHPKLSSVNCCQLHSHLTQISSTRKKYLPSVYSCTQFQIWSLIRKKC